MKKLIIVFICFVCSGCFNYVELSDLGIVTALGFSRNGDKFIVDMQILNISENGDKGISESPISVISSEGYTILEAIRSLNKKSSKVFFPPNIEYVILDKSIFNEYLGEVIDFIARDTKLSLNFMIVTSISNKPKDILSTLSEFNVNSGANVSEIIRLSGERYGASYALAYLEFLSNFLEVGVENVIPNLVLVGSDGNSIDSLKESDISSYVSFNNMVTFDSDGNVLELNQSEAFGYSFLKNNIKSGGVVTVSCGDDSEDYFTIETLKSNTSYELNESNTINIKANVEGEILYYGCSYDIDSNNSLNHVNNLVSEKIESYMKSSVDLAVKNKFDFIGIGNFLYKNHYGYFDFGKYDWNIFGLPNFHYKYDVKVNLYKQGNLKGDIR